MSVTAFAASDPITVVNNLSDFIFGLIRAIGLIPVSYTHLAANPEKTAADIYTEEQYQARRDVLSYAKDEEKTEREFFVEGINCNPATARDQFVAVKKAVSYTHLVDNIYRIWEKTADKKSAQLVFCDLSTPKNDGTFSVYNDIRKKLIERGVPESEVRLSTKQIPM